MQTEDSQVIGAVLLGNKDRYEELIEKYKRMVYGIAWSHLGDSELSEDVAQETFVKAYRHLGSLRDHGKFPGWLARIARNVCNSFGRRATRETAFVEQLAAESSAAPTQEDDRASLEEQMWQSFATLPAVHREALTIFYLEDKSLREATAVLGISETALKTRLFRARAALRQQLEQNLETSLERLEPSKDFSRSVLAILPIAPNGMVGAGGLVAVIGKAFSSLAFALWMTVLSASVFSWLMMWFAKGEAANIKDVPENQFRKILIRRNTIGVITGVVIVTLVARLLVMRVGFQTYFQLLTVFCVWGIWHNSKLLRVNTSRYAWANMCTMVGIGLATAAIGFFGAPYLTFLAVMIVVNLANYSARKDMPRRHDYNLFLRYASGGLGVPPDVEPPLPARLTRVQLQAFARFLGEQWLLKDCILRGDTIFLIPPDIRVTPMVMFGRSTKSRIIIGSDGTCIATVSEGDLREVRQATGSNATEEDMESAVRRMVRYALSCFVRGELDAARLALMAKQDDSIFMEAPENARTFRLLFLISIGSGFLALALFWAISRSAQMH